VGGFYGEGFIGYGSSLYHSEEYGGKQICGQCLYRGDCRLSAAGGRAVIAGNASVFGLIHIYKRLCMEKAGGAFPAPLRVCDKHASKCLQPLPYNWVHNSVTVMLDRHKRLFNNTITDYRITGFTSIVLPKKRIFHYLNCVLLKIKSYVT
jgi:hypothetical protein